MLCDDMRFNARQPTRAYVCVMWRCVCVCAHEYVGACACVYMHVMYMHVYECVFMYPCVYASTLLSYPTSYSVCDRHAFDLFRGVILFSELTKHVPFLTNMFGGSFGSNGFMRFRFDRPICLDSSLLCLLFLVPSMCIHD